MRMTGVDRWLGLRRRRRRGRRCSTYALRVWLTADPQEAFWAARQLFDAADLAYFQANPGDSLGIEAEKTAWLESRVIQSAISAIQRDLEAAENARPWSEMRQSAEGEGSPVTASRPRPVASSNQLGNEGAHPEDYDDVTEAEATGLGKFVRHLIRYEYEMPAQLLRQGLLQD
jgi:hypothetical protein